MMAGPVLWIICSRLMFWFCVRACKRLRPEKRWWWYEFKRDRDWSGMFAGVVRLVSTYTRDVTKPGERASSVCIAAHVSSFLPAQSS